MRYVALLTALGLVSAASLAFAAPDGRAGAMSDRLKQADSNADGMISREEAKALPRVLQNFDAIDANKDGQVTADEMRAYRKAQGGERGKHRGDSLKKLDTDGDGRISKAEAQAAPRLAEHFDTLDANKDGFVTTDEMKAAHGGRERAAK
jgi:Ca2+-binding EF-hand superfamily protein